MEERTCYPLMRAQKGLALLFGFYPDKQILNICVRVRFAETVDEDRLAESIRLLPSILPYCRIRICLKDGQFEQYVSDDAPEAMEIYDAPGRTEEEMQALYSDWAHELFPNDCMDVQLYRARLVRREDNCRELFFLGHHFIMDAYAVIGAIEHIGKIYKALEDGTPLPKEAPLPWEMVEQEAQYYASPRYEADVAWWKEFYREEPHFTSLNGLGSPEFIDGHSYGRGQNFTQLKGIAIDRVIPASLVERVNAAARDSRLAVQLYYLLALRTYLGKVSGTDDVIIDTVIARRSTLTQKRSGLSRANTLPLRSVIAPDTSFRDALLILDGIQKEIYRHADVLLEDFTGIINAQHKTPPGCTYHTTWLTYQPYFDLSKSDLKFQANSIHNGAAATPLYVYITPQDASGELIATYNIALNYIRPESVDRFHAFLLRFLENGILTPEESIGSLLGKCL